MFVNCPSCPVPRDRCSLTRVAVLVSRIFAFTLSATAMIDGSLSPRRLNLPTNRSSTKSATELARSSVAPFFCL